MNTIDEAIEILQAMKAGKKIQYSNPEREHWANYISMSLPNFQHFLYRIKPEPKEIWVNEYATGDPVVHSTEKDARKCALPGVHRVAVRYREVIE